MAINLDNAQYGKFVQFAEQQMRAGNTTAVARDGSAANGAEPLAGRTIVSAVGVDAGPLRRSRADKDANDLARSLFRQTIADMFGGEAMIPRNVKKAMLLSDYGHGRPLTAHRIFAVKAEIDKLAAPYIDYNNRIAAAIMAKNLDPLPDAMTEGFAQAVDTLRGVFGADAVRPGANITQVLSPTHIHVELNALRDAANAKGRELTSAEVVSLYATKAFERLALIAAGKAILAKVQARDPEIPLTELSAAVQFNKHHPGLLSEICACKNPAEIAAAIQRHEAEIDAFVGIAVHGNATAKTVEAKATEKLATALGLDARFVAAHVPMGNLVSAAKNLTLAIMNGEAPGSREVGYDVEAAYDAVVDEFVQKRVDACAAVDSLNIPENVKNRWKAAYIAYHDLPVLTPAQLLEVANSLDARKLASSLSSSLPMKIAVEMLHNDTNAIIAAAKKATGNPRIFANSGPDDMMPIYGMLVAFLEARNPALAPAIDKARKSFLAPAERFCEKPENVKALSEVSIFIKTLSANGGAVKTVPVTNKTKYLALVESETEAAIAESGITDEKVRNDVKDAMLKLGRGKLKNETGLKNLSDFIATAKAEATALAKTLDKTIKEMTAKYSQGLPQETLPLFTRLVRVLDWRGDKAAESELILKNYAEDMTTWRNVTAGSADSKGLEEVLQRRMNGYLKHVLEGDTKFNTTAPDNLGRGLFQTFLDDLPRASYTFNGNKAPGTTVQTRIAPFFDAIKDPEKRKTVSVMINQQIYGDYTTSVANRYPLVGWTNDIPDEESTTIPGIEKFATRDIEKMGFQLFDTGPMGFSIEVAPDESTVTVHSSSEYPMHAHISVPNATIGICTITQDFVIDFTGAEPVIRDFKIGQTFA